MVYTIWTVQTDAHELQEKSNEPIKKNWIGRNYGWSAYSTR